MAEESNEGQQGQHQPSEKEKALAKHIAQGIEEGLSPQEAVEEFWDESAFDAKLKEKQQQSGSTKVSSDDVEKLQGELEQAKRRLQEVNSKQVLVDIQEKYPRANMEEIRRLSDKGAPENVLFREAKRDNASYNRVVKEVSPKIQEIADGIASKIAKSWGTPISGPAGSPEDSLSLDEWKKHPDRYSDEAVDRLGKKRRSVTLGDFAQAKKNK